MTRRPKKVQAMKAVKLSSLMKEAAADSPIYTRGYAIGVKRLAQKANTPPTTGRQINRAQLSYITPLPPDHPLYTRGWIIGGTFSGSRPDKPQVPPKPAK